MNTPRNGTSRKTGIWTRICRLVSGACTPESEVQEERLDAAVEELQSSLEDARAETEAAKRRARRRARPAPGA